MKTKHLGLTMLKSYTVFNISQCDGLPDKLTAPPMPLNPDQREALIDEFVAATGIKLQGTSGDEAFYRGGDADFIAMPAFEFFRGRAHFCATRPTVWFTPLAILPVSIAVWGHGSGCRRIPPKNLSPNSALRSYAQSSRSTGT